MSFWNRALQGAVSSVKAAFGYRNPIQAPAGRSMGDLLLGGGSMGFPGAWTSDRIEQSRHMKGWTYVAIKAIAEEVACMPPSVAAIRSREEAKAKSLNVLDHYQRRKALVSDQSHEHLEPIDSSHALCRLLANPNGPDVAFSFWYETMMYLELTGNAYWWVVNNRLGVPCELWVLPSQWVWPMAGNGNLVDYYEVRPYGAPGAGKAQKFAADEIIPFSYKNPQSKIDGLAPLAAAAEWVDTSESIDATRWHSFKNGLWPGMVMTLDKEMEDPDTGTLDAIYTRLDARARGEHKTDRPLILPPGVTANQMTRNPREMDFQSSGDQMRDWIMAVHRVGKSIAGVTEDVNYASMVASTANFIMRTIRPKLSYIGQVATEKLAKRFDPKLVVYWNDTTPDDPQQTTSDLNTDFNNDALTLNEYRKVRGRPPLPHGDKTKSQLQADMAKQQQQQQQAQQGQNKEGQPGNPSQPGEPGKQPSMGEAAKAKVHPSRFKLPQNPFKKDPSPKPQGGGEKAEYDQ